MDESKDIMTSCCLFFVDLIFWLFHFSPFFEDAGLPRRRYAQDARRRQRQRRADCRYALVYESAVYKRSSAAALDEADIAVLKSYVCVFYSLSLSLSVYLSVFSLSLCLSVYLSIHLSVRLFVSVWLSLYLLLSHSHTLFV